MKKQLFQLFIAFSLLIVITACGKKEEVRTMDNANPNFAELQAKVDEYAPIMIQCDLSHLTDREKALVGKLAEAGRVANEIFWMQSSHDAVAVRDSLSKLTDAESKLKMALVNIYFGPYDKMDGYKRFVGTGAERRPDCSGFYPIDMTKEEFEQHVKNNPKDKDTFESGYTVIVRDENKKLKAIPFHEYYPLTEKYAKLLDEAADLCDNPSLKKYLQLRATAARTDNYFESDMAWMDISDNNIDVAIGPIESYEDGLYNYKTAYEAVVMVKDVEATKELDMFKQNIENFQQKLPWDKKFYVNPKSEGTILQMVNVAYFGGDCQKASKTIAAALPNDPNVTEKKGGKKSMYKNMMEAKFDKILQPISKILIAPDMQKYVIKKNMVSFVTLHEVSHNLGRGFVFKNDRLTVRAALKEKYSPLEELKADICAMYNMKMLHDDGKSSDENLKADMVTYVAGLFRSMRFGVEDAHGVANFIQYRYLLENGGILKTTDGYYTFDEAKFFAAVEALAKLVLEIQATGDYKAATDLVKKYGDPTPDIMQEFERVKTIPRDLNSTYIY